MDPNLYVGPGAKALIVTQWSIVFDSGNQTLYFRTRINPDVRSIDLSEIDFSCEAPIKMIDIDADLSGDITESLEPYSTDGHLSHAVHAMASWGGNVSRESMARQIQHIEGFECQSD